jgi:hypothetical protein
MLSLPLPPTLRKVAPRAALIWAVSRVVHLALTFTTLTGDPLQRLGRWYFWDAGFYWGIAARGYTPDDPRLAAYFPLYPLLVFLLMHITPELIAALVISSLALLAALIAVGWLSNGAWAPMLLLAASPLAFFFSGIYADGLFVAFAAGALLAYQRERWTLCGICAASAVVTRPFGMALVAALIIAALLERRAWDVSLWLSAVPGLFLQCYVILCAVQYHDPLAFVDIERSSFGRSNLLPWQTLWLQAQEFVSMPSVRLHMLLDIIPVLVCIVTLVFMARRWPLAWTLYVAFALLLILTTPVTDAHGQYALVSAGRYTYALVPVLLACATWLERLPRVLTAALLAASSALQIGLTVFVLHGGWIV